MALKRVIFALYYDRGTYCLSRNFNLQSVGDIDWLIEKFRFDVIGKYVDEIILYNVNRDSNDFEENLLEDLKKIQEKIFLPLSIGGNLHSVREIDLCFKAGFDKVIFSGQIFDNQDLVQRVIEKYGSQAAVIQLDYRVTRDGYTCYTKHGTLARGQLCNVLSDISKFDYGELVLNNIDLDGTGFGFDLPLFENKYDITHSLLISGGAGNLEHFADLFSIDEVSAGITGDLFNFIGDGFKLVKEGLLDKGIQVRRINFNEERI